MAFQLPPPPVGEDLRSPAWRDWLYKMSKAFSTAGSILWTAITLPSSVANTVLAGPTTGADATAAFRALVAADLPTVTVAKGGTGQTTYTNGQLLIGNTSGNTLTKATLTAGSNVTITNGAGTITIASTGGGGGSSTGGDIFMQQNFQGF